MVIRAPCGWCQIILKRSAATRHRCCSACVTTANRHWWSLICWAVRMPMRRSGKTKRRGCGVLWPQWIYRLRCLNSAIPMPPRSISRCHSFRAAFPSRWPCMWPEGRRAWPCTICTATIWLLGKTSARFTRCRCSGTPSASAPNGVLMKPATWAGHSLPLPASRKRVTSNRYRGKSWPVTSAWWLKNPPYCVWKLGCASMENPELQILFWPILPRLQETVCNSLIAMKRL